MKTPKRFEIWLFNCNPSIGTLEERYKEKVEEALKRILDLE